MHAFNQFLQCQHSLFLSASRLADFLNVTSQGAKSITLMNTHTQWRSQAQTCQDYIMPGQNLSPAIIILIYYE